MRPSSLSDDLATTEDGAAVIAFPVTPERRLRVALRKLDEALAEQRAAVTEFRQQIAGLKTAVAGLGESTLMLRDRLDEAAQDNARAQAEAARLQVTAAAMERLCELQGQDRAPTA